MVKAPDAIGTQFSPTQTIRQVPPSSTSGHPLLNHPHRPRSPPSDTAFRNDSLGAGWGSIRNGRSGAAEIGGPARLRSDGSTRVAWADGAVRDGRGGVVGGVWQGGGVVDIGGLGGLSSVTVVEVPQWRASGSSTARRLCEGATLLAGMTAVARRTRVEVVDGNSPAELAVNVENVRAALGAAGDGFVVTVGGDCGVELGPVSEAVRRFGKRLVVLWFDAHGDLNTPASSPSGAFHGMVLRALTGEGHAELVPAQGVAAGRVVLAGARDLDLGETSFIEAAGVRHLSVGELAAGSAVLVDAIASAVGDAVVYVHIDLDVLEPSVFGSVGSPAPGGLLPEQLLELVTSVAERFRVVGLGITEYEPHRAEDRELLTPLVEGLVKVCAP